LTLKRFTARVNLFWALTKMSKTAKIPKLPIEILESIGYYLKIETYFNLRNCSSYTRAMKNVPFLTLANYKRACLKFMDPDLNQLNVNILDMCRIHISNNPRKFLFLAAIGAEKEVIRWLENPISQTFKTWQLEMALRFAQSYGNYEDAEMYWDPPNTILCSTDHKDFYDYLYYYHKEMACALAKTVLHRNDCTLQSLVACFHCACRNDHLELALLLLLHDRQILVSGSSEEGEDTNIESTFCITAEEGFLEIVDLLMTFGLDPSLDTDYCVRLAAQNGSYNLSFTLGHDLVVERLLVDPRVDPGAVQNAAITDASVNSHLRTVQILMQHPSVNPADCNNRAFTRACQVDFVEMLITLRSDPRVKVEECGSEALECAAMNDCTTVLLYLLRECQIDPNSNRCNALWEAIVNGHVECARLLLNFGASTVSNNFNCIIPAAASGNLELFKMVFYHEDTDISVNNWHAWRAACYFGRKDLASIMASEDIDFQVKSHVTFPLIVNYGWKDIEAIYLAKYKMTREEVLSYASNFAEDGDSSFGSLDEEDSNLSWTSDDLDHDLDLESEFDSDLESQFDIEFD
jgi:hypothetical protein